MQRLLFLAVAGLLCPSAVGGSETGGEGNQWLIVDVSPPTDGFFLVTLQSTGASSVTIYPMRNGTWQTPLTGVIDATDGRFIVHAGARVDVEPLAGPAPPFDVGTGIHAGRHYRMVIVIEGRDVRWNYWTDAVGATLTEVARGPEVTSLWPAEFEGGAGAHAAFSPVNAGAGIAIDQPVVVDDKPFGYFGAPIIGPGGLADASIGTFSVATADGAIECPCLFGGRNGIESLGPGTVRFQGSGINVRASASPMLVLADVDWP